MAYLTCGRKLGLGLAAGTTMFVVAGAVNAQEIVYNDTTTPLGTLIGQIATGATTGYEAGDQITLGGAGRVITQFAAYPYNLGAANSGTAQVRFYDTPGSGANPGVSTILWDSGPVSMSFPTGQETLNFPVPNITVPNTMVWTVTFTFATAATNAFGARVYDPPTVGSSADFFWAKDVPGAPGWTTRFFNGAPIANFGAQLIAQNVVANGACCKTDGTCADLTNTACAALTGAVYQGPGTACATTTCPQPGSCCVSAGVCSSTVQSACLGGGGVFGGEGTTCASATCNPQYFLDDGTGENGIGFNVESASVAWMNRFTVANGKTTINAIDIAFGTNGATATPPNLDGVPVTVYLWSDPDGNGDPSDGVVLASVSGVVANSNTDIYNTFTIPATNVGPNGTNFFVGAIITETLTGGTGVFPSRIDQGHSQGKSWILGTTGTMAVPATPVNPAVLTGAIVIDTAGLPGNWMIRADAASGPTCYANCDSSTGVPFLNVADFTCFLQKFAAAAPYANCDNSTSTPTLNVADFTCFLQKFAAGCSAP